MINLEDETEKEDFLNILKEFKLSANDYNVDEVQAKPGRGIQPINSKITVTNIKTNKSKVYQSGHGTAWFGELRKDLKNGFFK